MLVPMSLQGVSLMGKASVDDEERKQPHAVVSRRSHFAFSCNSYVYYSGQDNGRRHATNHPLSGLLFLRRQAA